MKKLIFSFYIFSIGCLLLSCEEQDNFGIDQADKAFNLRMRPDKNSFDISAGDPEINFTIYSDTKTIDHIEIFVDLVESRLVIGVGMDRGHETVLDTNLVIEHLGHGRQAIGCARCVGNDTMILG